jgi:hypothetical protein
MSFNLTPGYTFLTGDSIQQKKLNAMWVGVAAPDGIDTGDPTDGTSATWKLGSHQSATASGTTGYLEVEVGGVAYEVPTGDQGIKALADELSEQRAIIGLLVQTLVANDLAVPDELLTYLP